MTVAATDQVQEFRRRALLRAIADGPTDAQDTLRAWADRSAIWDVFADDAELLVALQDYWIDLLSREIYAAPRYPLGADRVRAVYQLLSERHPALRSVLDQHEHDSAISSRVQDEHVLLARAAGYLERVSTATLFWRGQDVVRKVPTQRPAQGTALRQSMADG